ncbi:hypothetical protein ACIQU5_27955 [Streptomyces sp. NPDC090306]|uniref:hypothetical protein n=1 Tax=Streptomyces sp. NPDC090306 TaxID=3365961 RepID=UPI0037F3FC7D
MANPKHERAARAAANSSAAKWRRRAAAAARRPAPPPLPTLGSREHCWCGAPRNHTWPGQDTGTPHPRDTKETS